MNVVAEISQLANTIGREDPGVEVDFAPLPSGVVFLHVRVSGRCFVIAHYPQRSGFGVDEVLDGEGFETGYRYWYPEFSDARRKLLEFVSIAQNDVSKDGMSR